MSKGKADPASDAGAASHQPFDEANEDELAARMFSMERGSAPGTSRVARRVLALIAEAARSRRPAAEPRPHASAASPADGAAPATPLTPRELQVLQLMSQGLSNRRIADALTRSANTIDTQAKSIYRKLAVNSRTQAVRKAMALGLVRWDEGSAS